MHPSYLPGIGTKSSVWVAPGSEVKKPKTVNSFIKLKKGTGGTTFLLVFSFDRPDSESTCLASFLAVSASALALSGVMKSLLKSA
jgi:hypothetical protein